MKKMIVLLLFTMFLSGCAEEVVPNTEVEHSNIFEEVEKEDNDIKEPVIEEPTPVPEVEVIMTMYDFSENANIETYVQEQNEANGTNYRVYDDTQYVMVIPETERLDALEKIYGVEGEKEFLAALNEACPDVYTDVEFEEYGKTVILYANKENFDSAGLAGQFVTKLSAAFWSELCQSYNLIPLEERGFYLKIIDNENGEVLFETTP